MVVLKNSVNPAGMSVEIGLALQIIDGIYDEHGQTCTVTSLNDSKHSSGSLHYVGLAVDLRTRDIPVHLVPVIEDALKKALGPTYDVILESNHFHIEFQPKVGMNL